MEVCPLLSNDVLHYKNYKDYGAHLSNYCGKEGVRFSVWAPNASEVRVVGDFNGWNGTNHRMVSESGVWSTFVPGLREGELYKFEIVTPFGQVFLKSDPYAFHSELRPKTASRVCTLGGYHWHDNEWMLKRRAARPFNQPVHIYEVHLGSWRLKPDGSFLSYKELAHELIPYVVEMGYTHVELLPLAEHPYDGSWGYQCTGYYSVTSRYGSPQDFMYFVDQCHQAGVGVIMDWVPGHFCKDDHGLRTFDGTPLFEYSDPWRAENAGWGTAQFDLGKPEVVGFLISNALFWHEVYHVDGLRVDAVASMLYLDYDRPAGQWVPNRHGGRENLEAISFLRRLNEVVFAHYPGTLMMAEESTAWPGVTHPTYLQGLGFNYKWNMGWMNDALQYMATDPLFRQGCHNLLTFTMMYTHAENYILPLSHDEVVHGKRSLLNKMPGACREKFANLRLLNGFFLTHPGKKLMFMGGEIGQHDEWKDLSQLDWELLGEEEHAQFHRYVKDLNNFYRVEPALWELDHDPLGFEWIDPDDKERSVISFVRRGSKSGELVIICNFTPVPRRYRIGLPRPGRYREEFNSDLVMYGGRGFTNNGVLTTAEDGWHSRSFTLDAVIPPLAMIILKSISDRSAHQGPREEKEDAAQQG